ncbi:CAP domain-containing protein [Burkholderia cepacia]|uniref:CAP domain-containing protein n=1 Tax=Burkholderia cepacia TaxID=292 RepID=UPI000753C07D|nr:CAP domain-containing protein [Burkholderia cepacia]KVS70153.1 serine protease [Burkholderia cepacia]
MKKITTISLSALAAASLLALAACGGGGDGGSTNTGSTGNNPNPSNPGTPATTVPGTVDSPQYAAGSAQLAALNLLNQYRTQCGFPALKQNSVLDQAANAHAKYEGLNGALSDNEVAGNPGYTAATYVDRAVKAGFPNTAIGWGVGAGYAALTTDFTGAAAGTQMVNSLLAGVYHSGAVMFPVDTIGIGEYETQSTSGGYNWTQAWGSMSLLNTATRELNGSPLTFPCQGVTGVPYRSLGEVPTPPGVDANGWGTPIVVMANYSDTVEIQSASLSGPSGAVSVRVLNASTDPNKLVGKYQAVAYPTSALAPNATYNVTINGTVNGTTFSRSFSFTTGNVVG